MHIKFFENCWNGCQSLKVIPWCSWTSCSKAGFQHSLFGHHNVPAVNELFIQVRRRFTRLFHQVHASMRVLQPTASGLECRAQTWVRIFLMKYMCSIGSFRHLWRASWRNREQRCFWNAIYPLSGAPLVWRNVTGISHTIVPIVFSTEQGYCCSMDEHTCPFLIVLLATTPSFFC